MTRQINEWIFGDLLEGISLHAEREESMFADSPWSVADTEQVDGLMVSPAPLKVIELPVRPDPLRPVQVCDETAHQLLRTVNATRLALAAAFRPQSDAGRSICSWWWQLCCCLCWSFSLLPENLRDGRSP